MGLFSTLLHNHNATESVGEIAASASATTKSDSKSGTSELPTVVQLFTRQPIPLITDTAGTGPQPQQSQQPPVFAALHYTAVQCLTELSSEQEDGDGPWGLGGASLRGSSNAAAAARRNKEWLVPDLGVWNVQVPEEDSSNEPHHKKLLDSLLPLTRSNTFCIVVDCRNSNSSSSVDVAADLSQVEPSITKIQEALVRLLIQNYKGTTTTTTATTFLPTQTTSLYDLRSVQFGLGDQDESAAARIHSFTATAPDEVDRSIRIALQICVLSPRHQASATSLLHDNQQQHQQHDYKTQQYQKVLLYHLHKYAAALHASLVFVADPLDTTGDHTAVAVGSEQNENAEALQPQQQQQPTVTTAQLPLVWKALAQGKPVWKYPTMEAVLEDKLAVVVPEETITESPAVGDILADTPEDNNNNNNAIVDESIYSLIYGPDNHNTELIESVLQRNANYPGHWDVATDSVWKILPPTLRASSSTTTTHRSNSHKTTTAGDVMWLTELRDSIKGNSSSDTAAGLQTPPPRTKDGDDTANKTPNDAAVSSFFQGLLS